MAVVNTDECVRNARECVCMCACVCVCVLMLFVERASGFEEGGLEMYIYRIIRKGTSPRVSARLARRCLRLR